MDTEKSKELWDRLDNESERAHVINLGKAVPLGPFEARVGDIRVRSLSFSLEGDLDETGHRFMRTVLGDARSSSGPLKIVPV
jgi:L-ascorbate metabolism protein UlaG (beta-lactamase superfamily)